MESITNLGEIMGDLIGQHHQLIELGKRKKSVLIAGDVNGLNQIVEEESKMIKRIMQLESERQKTISSILIQNGMQEKEISMSELFEIVGSTQEKEMLQSVQKELIDVLTELQEVNQLNQQLIKQSLDFVNYSIESMVGSDENPFTYGKPTEQTDRGNGSAKVRSRIFDTQI